MFKLQGMHQFYGSWLAAGPKRKAADSQTPHQPQPRQMPSQTQQFTAPYNAPHEPDAGVWANEDDDEDDNLFAAFAHNF